MFLVMRDSVIIDFDLDLLADVLSSLDKHLESICHESAQVDDPDSFGYYDRGEHVTGLGFVACQSYLTSTYGFLNIRKDQALCLGPLHFSGKTLVAVINASANYWKHHDEWALSKTDSRRKRIEETFADIGYPVDTDYPLGNILRTLTVTSANQFTPLLEPLAMWRDELRKVVA